MLNRLLLPSLPSSICLVTFLSFFAKALQPSPQASTDLICHTNHASECYSRIFQPTNSFQTVHDDQSLPPGLHIRMNLATGVKEAKLNEPDPEELENGSGLTIIDEVSDQPPSLHGQSNPQQTVFISSSYDVSEGDLFSSSVSKIKSSSSPDLEDVSKLQDLVHSSHWGLAMAKDSFLCHAIYRFLSPSTSVSASSEDLRSAAALLLATAIHNNPPALTATLSHFYNDEWPNGPLEAVLLALAHEELSTMLSRMVFLLSGLCRHEAQMQRFLNSGGLEILAEVFDADKVGTDRRDRLRGKIANFLLDHFLQSDEVPRGSSVDKVDETSIESEAESHFDNEDPWVIFNENDKDEEIRKKQDFPTKSKSLAQHLKPWYSLFENSSLRLGDKSETHPEANRALESIKEVLILLKEKLNN